MQETSFLTENQRVLKDIKKLEIFDPFQDEEFLNLLSMSKIRKYKPGEGIFQQGSSDKLIKQHQYHLFSTNRPSPNTSVLKIPAILKNNHNRLKHAKLRIPMQVGDDQSISAIIP